MPTLVIVRHGESVWNVENKFTGWVDCDLAETGFAEAKLAGEELAKTGIQFDVCYTSVLKRAIKTSNIILEGMDQLWIPVVRSWRLNERMYGALQGLNKTETVEKYGKDKVLEWRRSYDIPPPPMEPDHEHYPGKDPKYKGQSDIPATECLKDVIARTTPFWDSDIAPALKSGKTVFIGAHGNSLRALVKFLDNIPDEDIVGLEIPTGIPLLYQLDDDLKPIKQEGVEGPLSGKFLADPEKVKAMQEKVKNQISQK